MGKLPGKKGKLFFKSTQAARYLHCIYYTNIVNKTIQPVTNKYF